MKNRKASNSTSADINKTSHFIFSLLLKHRWLRISLIIILVLLVVSVGLGSASYTASRIVRLGLKDIGELTTQAGYFTNVQVIKNSKEIYGWTIPLTKSKYIFSYDGIVKAGIDFSQIDVQTNEITKCIEVILPEAEIFSLEIDPESLEIYDESKSVFTPLDLEDINNSFTTLQEEVRLQAIENGILDNAFENAKLVVENMLAKSHDMNLYSIKFIE